MTWASLCIAYSVCHAYLMLQWTLAQFSAAAAYRYTDTAACAEYPPPFPQILAICDGQSFFTLVVLGTWFLRDNRPALVLPPAVPVRCDIVQNVIFRVDHIVVVFVVNISVSDVIPVFGFQGNINWVRSEYGRQRSFSKSMVFCGSCCQKRFCVRDRACNIVIQ